MCQVMMPRAHAQTHTLVPECWLNYSSQTWELKDLPSMRIPATESSSGPVFIFCCVFHPHHCVVKGILTFHLKIIGENLCTVPVGVP